MMNRCVVKPYKTVMEADCIPGAILSILHSHNYKLGDPTVDLFLIEAEQRLERFHLSTHYSIDY